MTKKVYTKFRRLKSPIRYVLSCNTTSRTLASTYNLV
ncbi:hypothetical protein F383_31524 [Gossypium arboreum]|uniref:Uncharacterized protein n=1 Tax=Gossypium arboreum TaxID=29729 RepID=A0A0B0PIN2_GOSAR|nr:hypothetical protein F383_31524 [Gossypium arboreum]